MRRLGVPIGPTRQTGACSRRHRSALVGHNSVGGGQDVVFRSGATSPVSVRIADGWD